MTPREMADHALAAAMHASAALAAVEQTIHHLTEASRPLGVPLSGLVRAREIRRSLQTVVAEIDVTVRAAETIARKHP